MFICMCMCMPDRAKASARVVHDVICWLRAKSGPKVVFTYKGQGGQSLGHSASWELSEPGNSAPFNYPGSLLSLLLVLLLLSSSLLVVVLLLVYIYSAYIYIYMYLYTHTTYIYIYI